MEEVRDKYKTTSLFDSTNISQAAEYLCMELMKGDEFVVSKEALSIYEGFVNYLKSKNAYNDFIASVKNCSKDLEGQFYLIGEWLSAYINDVITSYSIHYTKLYELVKSLSLFSFILRERRLRTRYCKLLELT